MSATGSHPPIPRQPIGRTFVAAITILGFFAALQILAVVWRFLPLVSQQVAESAAARQLAKVDAVEEPEAKPFRPQPKVPTAEETKAVKLRAQADKMYRVGDFEQSLQLLNEAAGLVPDDPQTLFRQAQALDRLDRYEEAAMALQAFLKHPNIPADIRQQYEKKLEQYASAAKTVSPPSPAAGSSAETDETDSGSTLRDEVGLQPGSSLGVVDARLRDGDAGKKVLSVAIKSRPGVNVAWDDFKLYVYFYEQTADGEIVSTEIQPSWQWISPPVDWKDNEPEVVEVEYTLPVGPDGAASTERKFVGYVVGVYYNRELQDSRADPGSLDKKCPMPLYLKFNESGQ